MTARCLALAVLLASVALAPAAAAAPLDPDPAFGTNGRVELNPGTVVGIAYGPEMRPVPAPGGGYAVVTLVADGAGYVLSETRFTAAGALDGADARRTYPLPGGAHLGYQIRTVPDGSGGYYVLGVLQRTLEERSVVVHVTAGRELDTGFGSAGLVELPSRDGEPQPVGMTVQADGSLLAADLREGLFSVTAAVSRILPGGTLDPSFGAGGTTAPVVIGTGSQDPAAIAVLTRPADGTVTVAGGDGNGNLQLVRWTASGALDAGYGSGGKALIDAAPISLYPNDAAIDAAGRILVFADKYPSGPLGAVARVTPSGALDAGFGTGGIVTTQPAGSTASRVDGGLITAGQDIFYVGTSAFVAAPTQRTTIWKVTSGGASSAVASAAVSVRPATPLLVGSTVIAAGDSGAIRSVGFATAGLGLTVNATTTIASRTIADPIADLRATSDGRLLGIARQYDSGTRLPVAALTAGGLPDPGLAANAGTTFGGTVDVIGNVTLPGGGFLTAVSDGAGTKIVRFGRDGTPDPGFGTAGVASVPAAALPFVGGIAALPDGRVVLAGGDAGKLAIGRLTAAGVLDPALGGDGTLAIPSQQPAFGVAAAGDGSVVVRQYNGVVRITGGGSVDDAFTPVLSPTGIVSSVFVDHLDRVLYATEDAGVNVLHRRSLAGVPDPSFGTGGAVTVPTPDANTTVRPDSIAELPSGDYAIRADRFPTAGGGTFHTILLVSEQGAITSRHTFLRAVSAGIAPMPDGRIAFGAAFNGALYAVMLLGAPPDPPVVAATAPAGDRVIVTASADARGLTGVTLRTSFGETTGYGSDEAQELPAARGTVTRSRELTGLQPGRTYHVRATVTNASGAASSTDVTVTTPEQPGARRSVASTARITLPRKSRRHRVSAWRTLRGTARLSAAARALGVRLARVEVNVVRRTKDRRGRTRCRSFTGRRFAAAASCAKAETRWVRATGTTAWRLRLRGLGRGRFVVRVRTVNSDGVVQTRFVTGASRVALNLTR